MRHSTLQSKHESTRGQNDLALLLLDETAEPKALPLSLLRDITNDFSEGRRIGTGGFATVYEVRHQNCPVHMRTLYDADKTYFNYCRGYLRMVYQ